jgi:hypothetical protein
MNHRVILLLLIIILILLLIQSKETFIIHNRLYRVLNVTNTVRQQFTNQLTDDLFNKIQNKYYLPVLFKGKSYIPQTIRVNNINDINAINDVALWFVKGCGGGGGSRVYPEIGKRNIINRVKELLAKCPNGIVLQENIESLLIDNKKCDLRIFYIGVHYKNKLYFYLQTDGFLKLSNMAYDPLNNDKSIHVTNTAFQKNTQHKALSSLKDYPQIKKNLIECHRDLSKVLADNIKPYKSKSKIEYQISGSDFIIDKNNKVYLLEFNTGVPAYIMKTNPPHTKQLKLQLKQFCEHLIYLGVNNLPLPANMYGFVRV